jgi:hypothetical protein
VFDPEPWEKKTFEWKDKTFLFRTVPQFLHMPLPWVYGKAIRELDENAEYEGIKPPSKDFLLLASDPSPWKSELYYLVTESRPNRTTRTISGSFASRVFDGPYSGVPSYMKEMDKWLAESGRKAEKYYFYYTTCPKCAKKYGHNYIVVITQI